MEKKHDNQQWVEASIRQCQRDNHIQQVVFSTYHHALTQICFTCEMVRTSLKENDLELNKKPEEKK